jgi:hypothetical protein
MTVLLDSWKQCQDADVLIQSPSAMAGVHIAEALSTYGLSFLQFKSGADPHAEIPFFHAFTMYVIIT